MKPYFIKRVNDPKYVYIIFSTSFEDPFENINEIEEELKDFSGRVLFDLLLSNGRSINRFVEADFVQGKINFSTLKIVKSISENLKSSINNFYTKHTILLDNSVLTSAQKFLIKQGVPLY